APQYDQQSKKLSLAFTIDEGPRVRFGAVAIKSGIAKLAAEDFRQLIKTNEGGPYNADAIDATIAAILAKLAARGEPFVEARPHPDAPAGQKTINVISRLEGSPPAYVERIEIRGNIKTRENVIRREIGLVEGAPFNRALIEGSERRLKKLGFFKS